MKTKISILILTFFSVVTAYSQTTTSRNKELTRRIFKAFDNGDTTALNNLIARDAVTHTPMPPEFTGTGLQAVKEMLHMHKMAFPDMKSTIHVMAATGDTVMVYYTSSGTNSGTFMKMPPTNKKISVDGVEIIRFKNGKAVEHWGVYDNLAMMQQMGMMPPPSNSQIPPQSPATPQQPANPPKPDGRQH